MSLFITQIIYPEYLLNTAQDSYLIGWNLQGFRCCIVSIIPIHNVLLPDLLTSLEQSNTNLTNIHTNCSGNGTAKPCILGIYTTTNQSNNWPSNIQLLQRQQHIWIHLSITDKSIDRAITLLSLFSSGYAYDTHCCFIEYKSKQSHQLDCYIYDNNKGHNSDHHSDKATISGLPYIIAQINCAYELQSYLLYYINQKRPCNGTGYHPISYTTHASRSNRTISSIYMRYKAVQLYLYKQIVYIMLLITWCGIRILRCISGLCNLPHYLSNLSFHTYVHSLYTRFNRYAPVPMARSGLGHLSERHVRATVTHITTAWLSKLSFAVSTIRQRIHTLYLIINNIILYTTMTNTSIIQRRHIWNKIHSNILSTGIDMLLGCIVSILLSYYLSTLQELSHLSSHMFERTLVVETLNW